MKPQTDVDPCLFISDKVRQEQYDYLSTASISEVLSIPKPTLVKIMQSLTGAGIIETKEGKHGGIRLAKDPAEITVFHILEAVEKGKPLFQTSFDIRARGQRPDKAREVLLALFERAESRMQQELNTKTIAEIMDDMGQ